MRKFDNHASGTVTAADRAGGDDVRRSVDRYDEGRDIALKLAEAFAGVVNHERIVHGSDRERAPCWSGEDEKLTRLGHD